MDTPDMLTLAQETLRDITGVTAPMAFLAQAQFAQAAATIALVERMDKLVALLSLVVDTDSGAIRTANWALPV